MSPWSKLVSLGSAGARAFGSLFDSLAGLLAGDPTERRELAFSAAMIGLSAKMAKSDGVVTRDEVSAFQRLVRVPANEAVHVARLFNLARQDVAGYQSYARKIAGLYPSGDPVLTDLLDGLFAIATADGVVHPAELAYLREVGRLLGVSAVEFDRIVARHAIPEEGDPYAVIGGARSQSDAELRRRYLTLVREHHPDGLQGRGVPEAFRKIATQRLGAINAAWGRIAMERGL